MTFDRVINVMDGCVTGVLMKAKAFNNINEFANSSISDERNYDVIYSQKLFGNFGQGMLNNMVEMYGFMSSGSFQTCEPSAIAEVRLKNVNKNWLGSSNVLGERLYLDIIPI
jgi:hypothetical protein